MKNLRIDYQKHYINSALEIDKQHLTIMTHKKIQNLKQKLIMINEGDIFDFDGLKNLSNYQKAAINYVETLYPSLFPSALKLNPIFQSSVPSPVPLKSNMSNITWNVKDYIPFDTFTILNSLSRDYAYN